MSSTRRKQNNPTKSADDIEKKAVKTKKPSKSVKPDLEAPSLARSRPQRKRIAKRTLSPDVELSSRRKKRRKKKPPKEKVAESVNVIRIESFDGGKQEKTPNETKVKKKQKKVSSKKKKKKKISASKSPLPITPFVALSSTSSTSSPKKVKKKRLSELSSSESNQPEKKKISKKHAASKNILDVDQLRMLPAAELVNRFAKHTSFKVPSSQDSKLNLKQHVYSCKMLPQYCTEKFYGNEEDTRQQITTHLLRHVGELLTVTNRGLNPLKHKQKKPKHGKAKIPEGSSTPPEIDSVMYILPSAPRPMRVTLPKNVSSRMRRSSYTVIRSAEEGKGINEVVLLPKGRLFSLTKPGEKTSETNDDHFVSEDSDDQQVVVKTEVKDENESNDENGDMDTSDDDDGESDDVVDDKAGVQEATGVGAPSRTEQDTSTVTNPTGLSIDSLAKAVEAMVDEESQGLNIQAAEALANAMSLGTDIMDVKLNEVLIKKEPVDLQDQPDMMWIPSSPSTSTGLTDKPKKFRKSVTKKKKLHHQMMMKSQTVDAPYPDHNYAYTNDDAAVAVHLDSEGRPTDAPPSIEESEPDKFDVDPLLNSMNDQLNKLIGDIDAPPVEKVANENEEPPIVECANIVIANEEEPPIQTVVNKTPSNIDDEEIKQKAASLLQMMMKCRRRKGPFECQICHKHLTAASTLRAHYRSHAGIKPYQCKLCKATFTRLHSLKYHTMIHNKEARFMCSYCKRQFRHSSHYREHLRRHTGEEPFGCTDCPARFKTRNTYKRHLKAKHGKIVTEDGKIVLAPVRVFTE